MKINYITQQSWEKVYEPVNKEPSLTRESDFVSIQELFARFKLDELVQEVFRPIAELSPDEKDVLYNGTDLDDLVDEDLTVQKDFIDTVKDSLKNQEEEIENESAPTQPVKQDEPEQNPEQDSEKK